MNADMNHIFVLKDAAQAVVTGDDGHKGPSALATEIYAKLFGSSNTPAPRLQVCQTFAVRTLSIDKLLSTWHPCKQCSFDINKFCNLTESHH